MGFLGTRGYCASYREVSKKGCGIKQPVAHSNVLSQNSHRGSDTNYEKRVRFAFSWPTIHIGILRKRSRVVRRSLIVIEATDWIQ